MEDQTALTRSLEQVSGETDRQIVSRVLGIYDDKAWDIIDDNGKLVEGKPDLVMVHYNIDRADLAVFGYLRGVVVDTNLGIKVADSYGFTPTAVADAIMPDVYGNLNITDVTGITHVIPYDQSVIKYGLEGVLIRVFRWGGRTYYVSHRRFDISRSRWGDSPPFLTIYNELGGPDGDDLFDPDEQYSPFVHFFLASHPRLLHVTKDQVGKGFLYYIGYHQMWNLNPDELPFRFTNERGEPVLSVGQSLSEWQNDTKPLVGWINPVANMPPRVRTNIPSFEEESALIESGAKPDVIVLANLSTPEANTLLRYGYQTYPDPNVDRFIDPRLRTGEFIVIYKPDGTLLRVESTAYYWRARISDDNPNRMHRFYQLTSSANTILPINPNSPTDVNRFYADLNAFRQIYPPMKPYLIDEIRQKLAEGPILIWDTSYDGLPHYEYIETAEQRIYNVWATLFMASPVNRQLEIIDYFDRYFKEREELIDWLIQLRDVEKGQGLYELSGNSELRIELLIKKAEARTQSYLSRRRNQTNMSFDELFRQNIRELVQIESGNSVYSMVRTMKRDKMSSSEPTSLST